jgi:hypothetical protein
MSDRPDPVHNSEEPWTDEQVFRDTLEAADTWIEAANILGCSKETVRKWAIHYGMTPNKWGPWRDEQHLRDAIKDAETWKEAADTLGCTTIRTVQEWAERHGIDATLGPPWQDEQQLRDALEETDTWEEAADTLDCTVALSLACIVVDGEGFEPGFSCRDRDMAEAIRKRRSSPLYLSEDTFDGVPRAVAHHLEVVAVGPQYLDEVVGVVDEERHAVELIAAVQICQKPPRRLFRRRGKQPDVEELVAVRVDGGVQPVITTVDADGFLVDGQLQCCHRRDWP